MAVIPHPKPDTGARWVNGVCVDLKYLGWKEEYWGKKEQVMFTFQTDDERTGEPLVVDRVYYWDMHKWASLRADVQSWLGCKLTQEEADNFDIRSLRYQHCRLKIEPWKSPAGHLGWSICKIKRPGKKRIEPSGVYTRQ